MSLDQATRNCRHCSSIYGKKLDHSPVWTPEGGPWGRLATSGDCPSCLYEVLDTRTGELLVLAGGRCKRNDCLACGPWKARLIEQALHLARPAWLTTLGPVQFEPSEISRAVAMFRRQIRRTLAPSFEDAYFVEPYHLTSELHVHMYSWGAPLDDTTVTKAALATRLSDDTHVHVQPITNHARLGYGTKMITTPEDDTERTAFLKANNGRLVHATHRFWRGPDDAPANRGYIGAVARARA